MTRHGRAAGDLVALAACAVLACGVGTSGARADGDPASDYLLLQNVFFPLEGATPAAEAALEQATASVYAHGDRLKVAVIDTAADLGAIPSLFGKPDDYARFLGIELGLWYVGPLLVAMPAGFGIYDGGRSVAAEEQVLRVLSTGASTPVQLVRSATTAVQRLAAAGALRSPDIHAPLVTTYPASATLGRPAILHFDLFDDSGRSAATVVVFEGSRRAARLETPMAFFVGTRHASVRWRVPRRLTTRRLRFCVTATDPAGNRSRPSCALFLRISP